MTELLDARETLPIAFAPISKANPYDVYLNSLGNEHSRKTMAGCLDRIALILLGEHIEAPREPGRLVPWGELRYEHTSAIRARLLQATTAKGELLAPAYVNKHLAALRRVLKEAWRLELMSGEDYHRAIDLERSKGTRLPAGRRIAEAEVAALLQVCLADTALSGIRDAALIAFLQSTGGRRAEAAAARREDYDPGTRTLTIVGKRNKEREIDIHEQAAVYLGRWLVRWLRTFTGSGDTPSGLPGSAGSWSHTRW